MIAVVIPTYHRPQALEGVVKNVHEATSIKHTIYFVSEPDDQATIDEVKRLKQKLIINKFPGTHTGAANTAYLETTEPFFMIANDDFTFHKGWDISAIKAIEGFGVCGVNDGTNQNFTAITLVRRSYIEKQSGAVDQENILYHPGYHHNYVDTEFSQTAKSRGQFTSCPESLVEHRHYSFGKSPMDETYKKTLIGVNSDQALYESRKHLWS